MVVTLLPDPGPVCEVVRRYASARNVEFVLVQPSHLKNVIRVLFRQEGAGCSGRHHTLMTCSSEFPHEHD